MPQGKIKGDKIEGDEIEELDDDQAKDREEDEDDEPGFVKRMKKSVPAAAKAAQAEGDEDVAVSVLELDQLQDMMAEVVSKAVSEAVKPILEKHKVILKCVSALGEQNETLMQQNEVLVKALEGLDETNALVKSISGAKDAVSKTTPAGSGTKATGTASDVLAKSTLADPLNAEISAEDDEKVRIIKAAHKYEKDAGEWIIPARVASKLSKGLGSLEEKDVEDIKTKLTEYKVTW